MLSFPQMRIRKIRSLLSRLASWLRARSWLKEAAWPEKGSIGPELTVSRLEPRRVLSVNAVLSGGVLDISIQDDGGNTSATLLTDMPGQFFVDADGDQVFDPTELRASLADLREVQVSGDAGVGAFRWQGFFDSAPIQAVQATDLQQVQLDARIQVVGDVNLEADQVELGGRVRVGEDLVVSASNISDQNNTIFLVNGNASFTADTVVLGDNIGDRLEFQSLTLPNVDQAQIREVGSSLLVGNNQVNELTLESTGEIHVDAGAQLELGVSGDLRARLGSGSIRISGTVVSQGSFSAEADHAFQLHDGATLEVGTGGQILTQREVHLFDNSSLLLRSGDFTIEAGERILISEIQHDGSAADTLRIVSSQDMMDRTASEDPNIIANAANVELVSLAGDIGSQADAIDLAISRLSFEGDSVHLSNTGLLTLNVASRAQSGFDLLNTGALVIDADLELGATSSIVASGSITLADARLSFVGADPVQQLVVRSDNEVLLEGNATITGDLSVSASSIRNVAGAQLFVSGQASLSADAISLGEATGDQIRLGSLVLPAAGNIRIIEDDSLSLVGDSIVDSAFLQTNEALVVRAGARLDVQSEGQFIAAGTVVIDGAVTANTLGIQAMDSVTFGGSGSLSSRNGLQIVTPESIQLFSGSELHADAGDIELVAGKSIFLGEIRHAGSGADSIRISANDGIFDILSSEAPNVTSPQAKLVLESTLGSIGTATEDLNLAVANLQFLSPDLVHLSNQSGLTICDPSSAGAGLLLTNQGPLLFAANVDLGASSKIVVLDSSLAGDSITIGNGVTVTMDALAPALLELEAGDDIEIRGLIRTLNGPHEIQLLADTDQTGIGGSDGDRGVIQGVGSSVHVQTDQLTARAAAIDLTTDLVTLDAQAVDGDLNIEDVQDLRVTSAQSFLGDIAITTAGSLVIDFAEAPDGNVTLRAGQDIFTTEVFAQDSITADAVRNIQVDGAGLASTFGNIEVVAGEDGIANATIQVLESGDILVSAGDDILLTEESMVLVGEIGDIRLAAGNEQVDASGIVLDGITVFGSIQTTGTIELSAANQGDIGLGARVDAGAMGEVSLTASGFIDELAMPGQNADSDHFLIAETLRAVAGEHVHLQQVSIERLVRGEAGSAAILDGAWQQPNLRASERGDDFLAELGAERIASATENGVLVAHDAGVEESREAGVRESLANVARQYRFNETFAQHYAFYLVNDRPLEALQVATNNLSSALPAGPHVYLETVGENDLVVEQIATLSSNDQDGGIVLVAGGELALTGTLATFATLEPGVMRSQVINTIGRELVERDTGEEDIAYLSATKFDGGEGVPVGDELQTTTEFVIRDQLFSISAASEDFRTHVFQRVVLQFGFEGESGFHSFVGYFDGEIQQFSNAGQEGVLTKSINELDPADLTAITAAPTDSSEVGAFTRAISYANSFIDANQMLPTTAIVRRADDFFLFENSNAAESAEIIDLTAETFEIFDVVTLGAQGATELPTDPPQILPPPILGAIERPSSQVLGGVSLGDAELEIPQEKEVEVTIYRVFYEDDNQNGQVDASEIPDADAILEAETVAMAEESVLEDGQRIKVESLNTAGGSPNAEDLSRAKQELANDPNMPSGAYAIIEKGVDDKEVVLDVFPLNDSEANEQGGTRNADEDLFQGDVTPQEVLPTPAADEPEPPELPGIDDNASNILREPDSNTQSASLPSYSERLAAAGVYLVASSKIKPQNQAKEERDRLQRLDREARRQRRNQHRSRADS